MTRSGWAGPPEFNLAALDAGEAVVRRRRRAGPREDARTVLWRAYPAGPVPWVDERETAIELRTALLEVTRRLVHLDVASWQPEIPDLLMNLRHRPPLPLPPGIDARQVETLDRAVLCLEIVALARAERAAPCRRTRCIRGPEPSATSTGPHAGHWWRLLGPLGLTASGAR